MVGEAMAKGPGKKVEGCSVRISWDAEGEKTRKKQAWVSKVPSAAVLAPRAAISMRSSGVRIGPHRWIQECE